MPAEPSTTSVIEALTNSHRRLTAAVEPLDADAIRAQSYDDEWSIAQVLSHLGSQSDIFDLYLASATTGAAMPEMDVIQGIWDRWNAKTPDEQAADGLARMGEHVERLTTLSDAELAAWDLELFGADRSYRAILEMRLGEHAVHTWDIVVALDPTATLEADAAGLIVGNLGLLFDYVARSKDGPITVGVQIAGVDEPLVMHLTPDSGSLAPADESTPDLDGSITLSADAFVRLVYGRLDPDHTPPVTTDGVDLDTLRAIFPGV